MTGLWPFWNGAEWFGAAWWALVVISAFAHAAALGTFGIAIYLLFRGNAIALERRTFRTPDEFCLVQRRWGFWGLGSCLAGTLLFLCLLLVSVAALRQGQPY